MLAMPLAMAAESGWYPTKINTGAQIATNAGSARNLLSLVGIQTIAAAESADTDQIAIAHVNEFNSTTKFILKSSGTGSSWYLAQPDVPRNIIVTMNTSTTCAMKLTGTDIAGVAQTENLTWSAETGSKASTKAFKTVTRIDAYTSTNTAQGVIGTGDLLGLNTKLPYNTVLFCTLNNVREGTAPAVTTSSTTLGLNTIDTNSAPGGYVTLVYYAVPA